MAISQYLPNVNLIANYNKYHDIDNNPKLREDGTSNIGLRITIPLDISFNNDIQSNKIDYLQKKLSLDDKIKEEMSLYKTSIANIESIDEKIKITKDDIKLYDSLLVQLQEQYQVGMKTLSDVQTMENSKKIKSLDIKTLELQKQIKLLDIYSRLYNE
jgi:outer membrane protein TolC